MTDCLRRLRQPLRVLAPVLACWLLIAAQARASVVVRPPVAIQWQVVITALACPTFTDQLACTPFTAMSGTFGLAGGLAPAQTAFDVAVEGESTHKDHKGEFAALDGALLTFSLSGQYPAPPPAPGGPIPIPYPLFAYAPGSAPTGDTPPERAPVIVLGRLTSPVFEPLVLSGQLMAFDAPVQVGTWQVRLAPADVPEPATLSLVALALAGVGISRRRAG